MSLVPVILPHENAAQRRSHRRGITLPYFVAMIVVVMAMVAFAVDVGYIANAKTELKRAVDAGALAGAGALPDGVTEAEAKVLEYLAKNPVGSRTISSDDVTLEWGQWDTETRTFTAGGEFPSAVRVAVHQDNHPLFFARVLGRDAFSVTDESIASYRPRDIMLVLDYSASMNDDSELKSVDTMGASTVEANLLTIYQELDSPTFGTMQWDETLNSSWSNSQVKNHLGLNSVSYPYPSGSWDSYIDYVQKDSSSSLPSQYADRFGYMTLMNYLLEKKPKFSQTPDLWQTSEQPITALKNAVTVFLAYLQEVDTSDRLGLSVYTASDGTALLENGLTTDYQLIEDISRERQAGHYHLYTNIGDGMKEARLELQDNGRSGAFKLIVLITDGIANRPENETTAKAYALAEAQEAADAKLPIVTISLGANADTELMQQIADLTGGTHFNVPGGQTVAEYEEDLKDVFREIADDRPLMLVK